MDHMRQPETLQTYEGLRDTKLLYSLYSSLLILILVVISLALVVWSKRGHSFLFHGQFLFYYVLFSFWTVLLIPIFFLRPKNPTLIAPYARYVSFLLGVKWELRGRELLDELAGRTHKDGTSKGVVFVANHQSTLDALGLMHLWESFHPMAVVIKKEVFYVWPFGLAAYLAGAIYVDRSRGKNAFYSIEASAQRAAQDKGTRNRSNVSWDGDDLSLKGLLPLKSGAFRAAISSGIPVVPIVFYPYVFIDEKRLLFGQGKAIVKILPEISTTSLTTEDIPALMEKTHKMMTREYELLGKELLSEIPPDHLVIRKKVK
ncbi:1-acyl-sn-glycerol-3-phosphate acyltransferase alpha-like [Hetaerina americana]|uniref:1-acyl-sn-glycerol-3-phosphate acyltransferase alpha-like n=1 Tax=Hetaerina americana TaxID=62018 RepID=UPI003A7F4A17